MSILGFCEKVVSLRARYPFSVTSWYRTVERNALVGGVPLSLHLHGLAVDIVLDESVNESSFIRDAELLYDLKVIDEGDHLHIQSGKNGGAYVEKVSKV